MTAEGTARVYAELTGIFRDVFKRPDLELTPELSARALGGWDSFKQIEIILAVEEKYAIMFQAHELDRLRDVGDLARIVLARIENNLK